MLAEPVWDRGPGDWEPVCDDATGAGRCPAPPELLVVLGPWGLMELWGSKILFSVTQPCGNGGGGEGAHLAVRVKHRGVFHTLFPVPENHGTWETLVFGQHPEEGPQFLAQPDPNVCVVPCPLGPADQLSGCALAAVFVF